MYKNDEVLNMRFKICESLKYEVDNEGVVTVYEKQDHMIQKLFRKMKFKIPEYKEITFDEYSSEAFIQINGINTVKDIARDLQIKYGNRVNPLYERLLIFLNHIYIDCRYIEKIQ